MDISPEQRREYDQKLQDLSEKEILLEIMVDIKTIRHQMGPSKVEEEPKYDCDLCGETVAESDREAHMSNHSIPTGIDPTTEFTKA